MQAVLVHVRQLVGQLIQLTDGVVAKYWVERHPQIILAPDVCNSRLPVQPKQLYPPDTAMHEEQPVGQLTHTPLTGMRPAEHDRHIGIDDAKPLAHSLQNLRVVGHLVQVVAKYVVV